MPTDIPLAKRLKFEVALSRRNNPNAGLYASVDDFILRHGRAWTPSPLPEGIGLTPNGLCYLNAYRLMESGFTYVEGVAQRPRRQMLYEHAWCIDAEGRVVDPTWEHDEGVQYFGVAFSADYVRMTVAKKKEFGVIEFNEALFDGAVEEAIWNFSG